VISEKTYAVALWRLKKHRVPDRYDWLHAAIIEFYEKRPDIDEPRRANWLSLVAWRRWRDHLRRFDVSRVSSLGDCDTEDGPSEGQGFYEWSEVFATLNSRQSDVLWCWYSGSNIPQSAQSLGISPQRVHQHRNRIRRLLDGLPPAHVSDGLDDL